MASSIWGSWAEGGPPAPAPAPAPALGRASIPLDTACASKMSSTWWNSSCMPDSPNTAWTTTRGQGQWGKGGGT
jgi:hypothetical protein